jgi:hypothetical protein
MSKEPREEGLFCALNSILDAVTALNFRDLKAEAAAAVAADRGKTSMQGALASSKGKDKVANPSESPIVPHSPISVAVYAMANAAGGAGPAGGNPPPPLLGYASRAQFNAQ